jgi:hypothetical protein
MLLYIVVGKSDFGAEGFEGCCYRPAIVTQSLAPESSGILAEKLCDWMVPKFEVSVAVCMTRTANELACERDKSFPSVLPTLNEQFKIYQSGLTVGVQRTVQIDFQLIDQHVCRSSQQGRARLHERKRQVSMCEALCNNAVHPRLVGNSYPGVSNNE